MAGRGKSTIASAVIHSWKCRASCAIFHFRRGQNALNTRIVCALARQFGTSLVPEVRNAILESVQENEDIADQRLQEQFETLLVASLAKLSQHTHPILIVVDALDECDNPKDAIDFVRLIDRHSAAFPANAKFLITCRPEAPLLRTIEHKRWPSVDLDTAPDISGDLEKFIRQGCKQIRESDPDVPKDWPSSEDIERLVEMSQGLFQWACTAITYVSDGSPVDRLRDLLKRPSVWSGLDELYHQVLSKSFNSIRLDLSRQDLLCRVLGILVVAPYPVSLEVIATLCSKHEVFDSTPQAQIILFLRKDVLADLNSLLFIPLSSAEPVRFMHTSVHDLLVSEHRCKQQPYYVDRTRYHQYLATLCFNIMLAQLKENICDLSGLSKPNSDIQDIVEREVSKALQYCCRAWSAHLVEGATWPRSGESVASAELVGFELFELFSKERILCWIEVMSLTGAIPEAILMAKSVYRWLLVGWVIHLDSNDNII